MARLTEEERLARWRKSLEKTLECASESREIEDPTQRMVAYWNCRAKPRAQLTEQQK
jgi:hypothetical protein